MCASEAYPNGGSQKRVAVGRTLRGGADREYIGYRAALVRQGATITSVDVTGAASRFLPRVLVKGQYREELLKKSDATSDRDAPPESGNFDRGFVASAAHAARYARSERAPREREQRRRDQEQQ